MLTKCVFIIYKSYASISCHSTYYKQLNFFAVVLFPGFEGLTTVCLMLKSEKT